MSQSRCYDMELLAIIRGTKLAARPLVQKMFFEHVFLALHHFLELTIVVFSNLVPVRPFSIIRTSSIQKKSCCNHATRNPLQQLLILTVLIYSKWRLADKMNSNCYIFLVSVKVS